MSSGARYAALLLRAASSSACRPCCLVSTDRRATVTDPKSVSTPTPQGLEESGGEINTLCGFTSLGDERRGEEERKIEER